VFVFASLVIVFREVFEAGLIVGIVMAVTSGVAGPTLWIGGGVAAGCRHYSTAAAKKYSTPASLASRC
jgi:high-affinity iron transporter